MGAAAAQRPSVAIATAYGTHFLRCRHGKTHVWYQNSRRTPSLIFLSGANNLLHALTNFRWDGPAGGSTFRDPVAEPRPGSRSRAYVPGPSAGGWPKVALMTQVGPQYGSYGDRRCPVGPARWKKKMEGDPSTCRFRAHLIRQIGRPDPSIRWSRTAASGGGIDSQHPKDLEGLQSAFASTKTGLQRPAADLLVSRRTGRDARCRLVVRDATYKHVGLACRAQGANHTGFLPSCRTVSLIFCCLCAFCRAFLEGTTNAASRCCRFAL